MKKLLLVIALFGVSNALFSYEGEVFAHSYMYTRPAFFHVNMQQQLWHSVVYAKKGDVLGGIQVIPFYQKSISLEKTARYFLMNGKNCLLVSGDANTSELPIRDIRAEWLGLPSNFHGKLSMAPKQKQFGATLEYHQDLKRFIDWSFLQSSWVSMSIPIMAVENNLRFRQFNVINPGTEFPRNLIEAFNNPEWQYDKFGCSQKKVGAGEIRLNFGTTFLNSDYFQVICYSSFTIPTGNVPNAEHLFSPVVGHGGFPGFGGGANFQILLNRNPETLAWTFFLNLDAMYLLSRKMYRTFDLCEKPWSRFLLFNTQNGTESFVPGVNVLTHQVSVKPYVMVDFSMGWRIITNGWEFELGYDAWGHGNEQIHFKDPEETPACIPFSEFGIAGSTPSTTASQSTIAQQAADDATFVPLVKEPLDLAAGFSTIIDIKSGMSTSSQTNAAHFAAGKIFFGEKFDAFLGFGLYGEFIRKNASLQTLGIWFKTGATF
jgi:hypothetical protein